MKLRTSFLRFGFSPDAGSFAQAHEQARRNAPLDMIILDLKMPGMDGLTGLRQMRAEFPNTPIVILSGSDDPEDILRDIMLVFSTGRRLKRRGMTGLPGVASGAGKTPPKPPALGPGGR